MDVGAILKKENIFFVEEAKAWQEAIHIATMPLVEQGYCKREYIDGMIDNTHTYGAYYVLKKGFALLHARSEQGAIETQVAITVFEQAIAFVEDDKMANVCLVLVAKDDHSHLACMQSLATILGDEAMYQRLLQAKAKEEVYEIFTKLK